jgi:nucleoside-diphosphate-sugar epimerase
MKKTALVLGAGGFIGNAMVNRLKSEGYWVRGVDLKYPNWQTPGQPLSPNLSAADHFVIRDLRDAREVKEVVGYAGCKRDPHVIYALQFDKPFDEIYQFAADMEVMHNSATINLNVLEAVRESPHFAPKIFYSSSACIYPRHIQTDTKNSGLVESMAYPANPDSEYGWEKLFSERLYMSYARNYGIPVRIARYHNIYGPMGTWEGGREKAPAAMCRKVIA